MIAFASRACCYFWPGSFTQIRQTIEARQESERFGEKTESLVIRRLYSLLREERQRIKCQRSCFGLLSRKVPQQREKIPSVTDTGSREACIASPTPPPRPSPDTHPISVTRQLEHPFPTFNTNLLSALVVVMQSASAIGAICNSHGRALSPVRAVVSSFTLDCSMLPEPARADSAVMSPGGQ